MDTHDKEQILARMADTLRYDQLKKLRHVLETLDAENSISNDILLRRFLDAKKVEGCAASTIEYYRSTLQRMLDNIKRQLDSITADDLRAYINSYVEENKVSKVTADNVRRILSSFFSWLENEDYIIKSPVRKIHRIKTPTLIKETFTDEQLEALRDQCENIRDLAIIDLLASTGMRIGELTNLNRSDIDFEERECVVLGKGNKERTVYFDARTKRHLIQYLQSRKDDEEALFCHLNGKGNRLSKGAIETRIKRLGTGIQIARAYPHKFRRTVATVAIYKGMPIEQVQKLLGHARIDTTMHYAQVNQENVKLSHRRILG